MEAETARTARTRDSDPTVVPVTDRLIEQVARLRFEARTAAHPIADRSHHADLWIAASAIHIDAPLVTADTVFNDVPGLRLGA